MSPVMPFPRYPSSFRVLSGIAVGLISLFVLAIGLTVSALHEDAIRDADNDTGNIAMVLSGQISHSIQAVDIIASDIRDLAAGQTDAGPDSRIHSIELYRTLHTQLARLAQADVIAVIDKTGRVANSTTQWPPTGTDVSDRDYYRWAKSELGDKLYISSLLTNRVSGLRTIFFSKRISGPDNEFLGLVLIGLRSSYFESIYKSISPLRNQTFVLAHPDGTILVRYPDPIDRADQKIPMGSPWHKLAATGGGSYRSPGYFDGEARYVSVRPLSDYASLSYLTRYPLTRLKIDRSFVMKIREDSTSEETAIVRSIIVMAHNLGLGVIAEGVETAPQAKFLRAQDCEEFQGYLYAKPMPADEFENYLKATITHAANPDNQGARLTA